MKRKRVIIHRYNDARDLAYVSQFGCSETRASSRDAEEDEFDWLVVTPPSGSKIEIAVLADALSSQELIHDLHGPHQWPSGSDYIYRVLCANCKWTTVARVKAAFGPKWNGHWSVNTMVVEESQLILPESESLPIFRNYAGLGLQYIAERALQRLLDENPNFPYPETNK